MIKPVKSAFIWQEWRVWVFCLHPTSSVTGSPSVDRTKDVPVHVVLRYSRWYVMLTHCECDRSNLLPHGLADSCSMPSTTSETQNTCHCDSDFVISFNESINTYEKRIRALPSREDNTQKDPSVAFVITSIDEQGFGFPCENCADAAYSKAKD